MVLVIAGHVFSQAQFHNTIGCTYVWEWIYIFHMPLFVFISGYFSRKKDKKRFISGCWRLIEPLIIFQILIRGQEFILTGKLTFTEILTPWWILWYLLSLLYWRIILQVIPDKFLKNSKFIIISAVIISITAGFFPFNRFLSLQRTLAFMPFFFGGYYMRGKNLFIDSKYRNWSFVFLILTMLIPVFFSRYMGDLNQAQPYGSPLGAICRLLVFGLSIPMSVAFINLCPNNIWTAKEGKMTMQYYIYHALIIFILMKIISKYGLPTSFFAAVLYTILIIISIAYLLKIPFIQKLTNPSSLFK